ncbi:hypothetical protein DY000_02057991 [Brassica cretica]|uniref:Uncharacterized protein n=1 Tax=Brassica cretica TaxID=69181 RepID=A0ABQ7AB37_BRACR|nr:hypothetical protein DY000_02057991 [Brassica cretica]
MVKLTADLIWNSPHFFNAIKERELELRGLDLFLFPVTVLGFNRILLSILFCLQVTRFL